MGLNFGWHNHDFEFESLAGIALPLDLVLEGGKELVLDLDLAWVAVGELFLLIWRANIGIVLSPFM